MACMRMARLVSSPSRGWAGVHDITLRPWYKERMHPRPEHLSPTLNHKHRLKLKQPATTSRMLARTILATLVSAACFATVNAQTCSATNAVCCQQLQDPDNLNADALNLLRLLNINPNTLTGAVGLTCKRLTEACFACLLLTRPGTSLVSGSCNANAACCTGNNYVSRHRRLSSSGILTRY